MKIIMNTWMVIIPAILFALNVSAVETNSVEWKLMLLEHRVDDVLVSIQHQSSVAIDTCKAQIEFMIGVFTLAGVLVAALGFVGFKYVKSLRTLKVTLSKTNERAQKEIATLGADLIERKQLAEREMFASTHLNRAILQLSRSDLSTDRSVKEESAENALEYLELVEDIGYVNCVLYVWKGYALKRLNRLEEALVAVKKAINLKAVVDPYEKARATYNAACYSCLLGRKTDALKYLADAIQQRPKFKMVARNDTDFDDLLRSNSEEFRKLTAD